MSLNPKEFKKTFKRTKNYFEQEQIRFVLCSAAIKEEFTTHSYLTNQHFIDAIIMLGNTLFDLVKASYSDEVVSGFKSSLDKSMDEIVSIYRQKESKAPASIFSFEKRGRS